MMPFNSKDVEDQILPSGRRLEVIHRAPNIFLIDDFLAESEWE